MAKVWKIVGTAALVLVVLGVVLAAVGWLTGASIDRMVEMVFGGWDSLELMIDVVKQELGAIK